MSTSDLTKEELQVVLDAVADKTKTIHSPTYKKRGTNLTPPKKKRKK